MSRHAALISFRGYRLLSTTSKFHSKGLHGITDHHVEATQTFYHNQLEIIRTDPTQMQPKPTDMNGLKFGHHFTDHMFEADWSHDNGWTKPVIMPFRSFTLHPAAKVLHYAAELFEGMKAFRGVDSRIRLFRPEKNMARMRRTAARASLPDFDPNEFLEIICELVKLENEWVPYSDTASLYIRPALIATEPTLGVGHPHQAKIFVICSPVASFYQTGSCEPVALLADPTFVRSFPGGVGSYKLGCNYAPTILIGKLAADYGCHQVLWLSGPEHKLTEVGAMNIFVYWKNKQGELELVTPPLCDGMILPGIIRDTVLTLAREWKEFRISERYPTMDELIQALAEGRLLQMFGSGTACAVTPIDQIVYRDEEKNRVEHLEIPTMKSGADVMQRLYQTITDIQHGRLDRPEWVHVIDC